MNKLYYVLITLFFYGNCNGAEKYYGGIPKSNATIIENTGFTVGYSDQRMNPLWVAYRVFTVKDPVSGK